MSKELKYAVFGAGSWATAIVKMLCENLDEVGWYMRSVYIKEHLIREQHNPSYLSSIEFKLDKLKLSNDINEIANYADVMIFVIPSAFMYSELQKLTVDVKNKIVVSAVKGIIPESGLLVGEHFHPEAEAQAGAVNGIAHNQPAPRMHRASALSASIWVINASRLSNFSSERR